MLLNFSFLFFRIDKSSLFPPFRLIAFLFRVDS